MIGELERLDAAALIVGPCDLTQAMFLHPLVPSALRECALDQLPFTSVKVSISVKVLSTIRCHVALVAMSDWPQTTANLL